MKKWFIALMISLFSIVTPANSVAAESKLSPYTYEGSTDAEGLYYGHGKLYYDGQLFYEGEFANGNFNGKGTLYQVKSDSSKALNTERNNIKYQGQFKNGLFHGEGTLYYDYILLKEKDENFRGQQYEGKFRYGVYYGYGTEYSMKGEVKNKGYFINGKFYDYKGPTDEEGKMHGKGQLLNSEDEVIFEGEFVHGEIHGNGTLYLDDERTQKYVGNFAHDQMEGEGSIYVGDTLYYHGAFVDGMKQGEGTLYFPDKTISYKGEFLDDRTKEQPFQIKSEIHVDEKLNGTYSVYVVLLDKYNTEATLKHFNSMKESVIEIFDDVKEIDDKGYQGFIATKDIGNIIESHFQDEFLGFQTTAIKTKMGFINHYEIFTRQSFTLDPNLMNVSHEIYLPENAKGIKVNERGQQMDSPNHYVWIDIQGENYLISQFQLYNPFFISGTVVFIIGMIGGTIYFRMRDKKKKLQQQIEQ